MSETLHHSSINRSTKPFKLILQQALLGVFLPANKSAKGFDVLSVEVLDVVVVSAEVLVILGLSGFLRL